MSDLETESRKLNAADSDLRRGLAAYIALGWSWEDIEERLTELWEEEGGANA